MSDSSRSDHYRESGVDLEAADEAVESYKELVSATHTPGVVGEFGGFGGLFSLKDAGLDSLKDPILVSGTDGVGTKLKLAFAMGKHDTVGIDCVAMCVNDIATVGARPLFFLDYLATGKLDPEQASQVVAGIARACSESGCALIGGETAEMPGFYPDGEYDIAGFCVGIVERRAMLGPDRVRAADRLIGIGSSGFHSNGFSLIRKVLREKDLDLDATHGLDRPLGAALLEPTRLYPAALSALDKASLRAAAHITGGGLHENLPRVLPEGFGARIDATAWRVPPVVEFILGAGGIEAGEAYHVFNMGIGMVAIVAPESAEDALARLSTAGYDAWDIGVVTESNSIEIEG